MSQVTNRAFFRARRGQSEALGAALGALVEPTRLEAGCLNLKRQRSGMNNGDGQSRHSILLGYDLLHSQYRPFWTRLQLPRR